MEGDTTESDGELIAGTYSLQTKRKKMDKRGGTSWTCLRTPLFSPFFFWFQNRFLYSVQWFIFLGLLLNRCCFCACAADTPPEGSKREKAGTPEKVKDKEQGSNPAGGGEGVKEDGKEGPSVEVKEERKDVKPRKEKIISTETVGSNKPSGEKYSPKVSLFFLSSC